MNHWEQIVEANRQYDAIVSPAQAAFRQIEEPALTAREMAVDAANRAHDAVMSDLYSEMMTGDMNDPASTARRVAADEAKEAARVAAQEEYERATAPARAIYEAEVARAQELRKATR